MRRHGQVPPGSFPGLIGGGAGEDPGHGQLTGHRVRFQHSEVCDHLTGARPAQAKPFPVPWAVPVAHRGHEVHPVHERPAALPDHDDYFPAGRGDLRCPARAGKPGLGVAVGTADHGGVDVAEPVELRRTEEPDADPPGLEPVVEDLRHAHDRVRGLGEHAVADRQREPAGLGADRARLVDEHQVRRVGGPRQVGGGAGQPDAHETGHAVAQRAGGADGHHLVGGERFVRHHGGLAGAHGVTLCCMASWCLGSKTSVSSHWVNVSLSRPIASHAT
jgi:hypothetical protein